jgi:hypothetical protein
VEHADDAVDSALDDRVARAPGGQRASRAWPTVLLASMVSTVVRGVMSLRTSMFLSDTIFSIMSAWGPAMCPSASLSCTEASKASV